MTTENTSPHSQGTPLDTFPYKRRCPFSMPAEYDQLRKKPDGLQQVEHFEGFPMWVATRYADVRAALTDPHLRNDRSHPRYPTPIPLPEEMKRGGSMLGMDGEEHRVERSLVLAEFTRRRAEALRPTIERIVDTAIDRMLEEGAPADLVGVGVQIAMDVITAVLGITSDDLHYLHERTLIMFDGGHSREERQQAVTEMNEYFEHIVERKLSYPTDDALSRIVARAPEPKDVPRLAELTRLLLNGGSDSTAIMISTGTLTLLSHPDQLVTLRSNNDMVVSAVEELLRFLSVADTTTPRVAVASTTINSTSVAANEAVFPLTGAANRDPHQFPDPNTFDISRTPNNHVAFGFGAHYCLGADLARVELQSAYTKFLNRLPNLRLTSPADQLPLRSGLLHGSAQVPVTWDTPIEVVQ